LLKMMLKKPNLKHAKNIITHFSEFFLHILVAAQRNAL